MRIKLVPIIPQVGAFDFDVRVTSVHLHAWLMLNMGCAVHIPRKARPLVGVTKPVEVIFYGPDCVEQARQHAFNVIKQTRGDHVAANIEFFWGACE